MGDPHLGDEVRVRVVLQLHELRKLLVKETLGEQLRDEGVELSGVRHRGDLFQCYGVVIRQRGSASPRRSSAEGGSANNPTLTCQQQPLKDVSGAAIICNPLENNEEDQAGDSR